jgi:hypothetical protein
MALVMAKVMGIPAESVHPVNTPAGGIERPKDSHLDCSALEELGIGSQQSSFRKNISELLSSLEAY